MEQAVQAGRALYGCPGVMLGSWVISSDKESLLTRAQLNANAIGEATSIYRLMPPEELGEGDSFLFVRKILKSESPRVPYLLQWALADTRDAAEMLRDVSAGPTPYFAVSVDTSCQPSLKIEAR